MTAPLRRGACPGLAAPMATGDGLLARLTPGGATIPLESFAGLTAAAGRHGSGVIEITGRGSIQVRGLDAGSASAFAAEMATLAVDGADGVAVTADALAGLDPDEAIDAGAFAAALRRALATTAFAEALGAKVSVVVDGGGALHLDAVAADVRLRAATTPEGVRLRVALGGDAASATPIGAVLPEHTVEAVVRLLAAIAARGRHARARSIIDDEGPDALQAVVGDLVERGPAPPARPAAEAIGLHRLRHGRVALGIGLAFGHSEASTLGRLIDAADAAGAAGIRTAPRRALLIVGITPDAVPPLAEEAARLGFLVRASDPRRHIAACAGAPVCASGEVSTRALGPEIATAAASLLDGSVTLHLSGCAKGCAHPGRAALTLVGRDGACGVIVDGAARDVASGSLAAPCVPGAVARLARAVERARRPGERTAETLSRLGRARVAATLAGEAVHG